jgi:hypothetical protein
MMMKGALILSRTNNLNFALLDFVGWLHRAKESAAGGNADRGFLCRAPSDKRASTMSEKRSFIRGAFGREWFIRSAFVNAPR